MIKREVVKSLDFKLKKYSKARLRNMTMRYGCVLLPHIYDCRALSLRCCRISPIAWKQQTTTMINDIFSKAFRFDVSTCSSRLKIFWLNCEQNARSSKNV